MMVQQHLLEQRTRLSAFNGVFAPPAPLLYFSCESSRPVCWPESTVKHYIPLWNAFDSVPGSTLCIPGRRFIS